MHSRRPFLVSSLVSILVTSLVTNIGHQTAFADQNGDQNLSKSLNFLNALMRSQRISWHIMIFHESGRRRCCGSSGSKKSFQGPAQRIRTLQLTGTVPRNPPISDWRKSWGPALRGTTFSKPARRIRFLGNVITVIFDLNPVRRRSTIPKTFYLVGNGDL